MSITKSQYDALKSFFEDLFSESDEDHVMLHASLQLDGRQLTFTHDKVNEQELGWLREATTRKLSGSPVKHKWIHSDVGWDCHGCGSFAVTERGCADIDADTPCRPAQRRGEQ